MFGKSLKRIQWSLIGVLFSFAFMSLQAAAEPITDPIGPGGLVQIQEQLKSRGAAFSEQAFLKASNAGPDDNFGVSVAINEAGNLLVVGARYEDSDGSGPNDNSIPDAGAAYVFERDNQGNWTEVAYLKPSLPYALVTDGAQFGLRVSISGQTVVVGEPFRSSFELDPVTGRPDFSLGAVYVFEPNESGDWIETALIENPSPMPIADQFGSHVLIAGDRLLISAGRSDFDYGFPLDGQGPGVVYIYERNASGDWIEEAVLRPDVAETNMLFGWDVDLLGNRILVGAPDENSDGSDPADESLDRSGAAYLFESNAQGEWEQLAWLKASNPDEDDRFGFSVALTPTQAIVGAYLEDGDGSDPSDNSVQDAGALYAFEENASGQWQQVQYLKSTTPAVLDSLGWSMGFEGDTLLAGANREDSLDGVVYVFRQDKSELWQEQENLRASNGAGSGDRFGHDVAINGGRILIAAWWEDSDPALGPGDNSLVQAGAAYVFGLPGLTIGGQVSGLIGDGLILRNTETDDDVSITVNGNFAFPVPLADGENYAVSVLQQPGNPEQICTVSNATGTLSGQDVTDIEVDCVATNSFSVGGTITGLITDGLRLQNNGGDDLSVSAGSTTFVFDTELPDGADYDVTVSMQPFVGPNLTCIVSNDSGTINGANIDNVQIDCTDDNTYSVGGTATGVNFTGLILQNNGGDDLTIISPGGPFAFDTELANGESYEVTIVESSVEPSQICTVSNGSGTINGSDVNDVLVQCSFRSTFPVEAEVTGLAGSGLVLQNNGGDDLSIPNNGTFRFATELDTLEPYSVTVATQPSSPPQVCIVNNGSGIAGEVSVIMVDVVCETAQYEIGGTVSDLFAPGLTLINNGTDFVTVNADGPFTFPALVEDGQAYNVTIGIQPADPSGGECLVSNGSGVVNSMNVDDIQVTCGVLPASFTLGGTVAGLEGSGLVLQNFGGDDLAVITNGAFVFNTVLPNGASYEVTVASQPEDPSQTCTVTNGSGSIDLGNVDTVEVTCVTNTFTVGGNVNGLDGTGLVLQNNGGDDLPITSDGSFAFPAQDDGSSYDVTVLTQPNRLGRLSQTCTVSNGSGTIDGADVSDIAINCETDAFTIGGTVSGLTGGGLTLQNNGTDDLVVSANGAFVFTTPLDDGSDYAVTVLNQPSSPNQICSVSNDSGTLDGADVDSVEVDCSEVQISLSTTGLSFDTFGDPVTQTVTISNPGSVNLDITSISSPTAPFELAGGDCLALPVTLAPGGSCLLDVRFTPATAGEFSSSIQISSNASSSPDQIDLRGSFTQAPMVVPVNQPLALILMMIGMLLIGLRRQTLNP